MAGAGRQGKAGEFGSVRKASCLCSAVMCSQEARAEAWLGGGAGGGRGGEQARVISTHSRPSGPTHRGEGQEREKKKKKRQERVAKLGYASFFFSSLDLSHCSLHCAPPRLSSPTHPHSPLGSQHSLFLFLFFFLF